MASCENDFLCTLRVACATDFQNTFSYTSPGLKFNIYNSGKMQPSDHPVLAVCRMCLTVTKSYFYYTLLLCSLLLFFFHVYSIPGSTGGLRPLEKVVSSLKLAGFISISEVSLTYIVLLISIYTLSDLGISSNLIG